jgi:hypothetical protein
MTNLTAKNAKFFTKYEAFNFINFYKIFSFDCALL